MIKRLIADSAEKTLVPFIFCYTVASVIFRESIGEKLITLLIPYSPELVPSLICVCLVALPLLYWNKLTRFYSGVGLGIIGVLLISAVWFGKLYIVDFLVASVLGVILIAICVKVVSDAPLQEAQADAPWLYSLAMGIIWLKTALMVAFSFGVIPLMMKFDEKPEYMSILMALTGCYLVFIGFGLAHRWKIALPLALWSEYSVAYTTYNQAASSDWNNTMAAIGQLLAISFSLLGAIAMTLLLSPSNLRYYFSKDEDTRTGPKPTS